MSNANQKVQLNIDSGEAALLPSFSIYVST
jgi:hypothetical protein